MRDWQIFLVPEILGFFPMGAMPDIPDMFLWKNSFKFQSFNR